MSSSEDTFRRSGTALDTLTAGISSLQQRVQARLEKAHWLSARASFDDTSRFVFYADRHRGVGDASDAFQVNEKLFLHALRDYAARDFTMVEVGDGDELWQNWRFGDVRRAHAPLFDLYQTLYKQRRLYLVIGNHDSPQGLFDPLEKDGIPVHQGLVLRHRDTGQELFAVHGHQADSSGDRFWKYGRWHSRYFMRYFWRLGLDTWHFLQEPDKAIADKPRLGRLPRWLSDWIIGQARKVEHRLRQWADEAEQTIICGHTHLPAFPRPGELPYFNTGSCINPGYFTSIELQDGILSFVKWTAAGGAFTRQTLHKLALTTL